ncbi:hypothetical protein [Anatilimnocola floriformis]|uniref:hypothetical protein n=1 Tax=Anatilimnocola floriformis TaxID=2948575 RepID=UPI0020C33145|nr:hypothetical protein [Anatilimnocola floriformis]
MRCWLANVAWLLLVVSSVSPAQGQATTAAPPQVEFTRLVSHWHEYDHPEYLNFIAEAQPEIVQLGEYGAHFYSLVHTPVYKGYPAHFPLRGINECGAWFEEKNREIHARGGKVIGHLNVEFLVGDPESPDGPTGFFKFYNELWDEKELGPKPVADPLQLLERGKDGMPIGQKGYEIGKMREYWACLRNPHWQKVLKAWVKRGVDRGVDGFIANYFYRHDCHCEHCQKSFRSYLAERHTPEQLKEKFAIADLARHEFSEIGYWHPVADSTPLKREMLRWSQISNKQVFDEVFHHYGRSLKKDLITAQWNHISYFSQIAGDERCLLPAELWGKDESYLWYSTGAAACYTDLKEGYLGEGTLQARYIRGMFDDKPFTLGKYENTRIRAAIAELAANGGAPMGFYTRFTDPAAREVITRYFQFMKQHNDIYHAARSQAEAVVLFPRTQVFDGNVGAVDDFKKNANALLDAHVLFDVRSDEKSHEDAVKQYKHVVRNEGDVKKVLAAERSKFKAPDTVRASMSQVFTLGNKAPDLVVHLVNYNREEPPRGKDGKPSPGGGIKDEKPIACDEVECDVILPQNAEVREVIALSPEESEGKPLKFEVKDRRIKFTAPGFLVYRVVRIAVK